MQLFEYIFPKWSDVDKSWEVSRSLHNSKMAELLAMPFSVFQILGSKKRDSWVRRNISFMFSSIIDWKCTFSKRPVSGWTGPRPGRDRAGEGAQCLCDWFAWNAVFYSVTVLFVQTETCLCEQTVKGKVYGIKAPAFGSRKSNNCFTLENFTQQMGHIFWLNSFILAGPGAVWLRLYLDQKAVPQLRRTEQRP